jgi:hypothetical protein
MIALTKIPFFKSSPLVLGAKIPSLPLAGGEYVWDITPTALVPKANLLQNSLYIVSSVSISVDISEEDWQAAIVTPPQLTLHRTASGLAPVLPLPIPFPMYLRQYSVVEGFTVDRGPDSLAARISGRVPFNADLSGKAQLTASVMVTIYEITDDAFIKQFMGGR